MKASEAIKAVNVKQSTMLSAAVTHNTYNDSSPETEAYWLFAAQQSHMQLQDVTSTSVCM